MVVAPSHRELAIPPPAATRLSLVVHACAAFLHFCVWTVMMIMMWPFSAGDEHDANIDANNDANNDVNNDDVPDGVVGTYI